MNSRTSSRSSASSPRCSGSNRWKSLLAHGGALSARQSGGYVLRLLSRIVLMVCYGIWVWRESPRSIWWPWGTSGGHCSDWHTTGARTHRAGLRCRPFEDPSTATIRTRLRPSHTSKCRPGRARSLGKKSAFPFTARASGWKCVDNPAASITEWARQKSVWCRGCSPFS
jgi:hypothetical protein